jgi:hypothetical protein
MRAEILLKWGTLRLRTLSFEMPEGRKVELAKIAVDDQEADCQVQQEARRVTVTLAQDTTLKAKQTLSVKLG